MNRHYLFHMIVGTIYTLDTFGIDTMGMVKKRCRDAISPWMEPIVSAFLDPQQLLYDKLMLAHSGKAWNKIIETGRLLFSGLPQDRLLQLKFEDMQASPYKEIQRLTRFIDPSMEDVGWLNKASSTPRPMLSKFEQLNANEQAALEEVYRPGLEYLGYLP